MPVRVASTRLSASPMRERGATRTCPVQFIISAVIAPVGVPSTRNSLTARPYTRWLPIERACCSIASVSWDLHGT
jgi:hypothetical protein